MQRCAHKKIIWGQNKNYFCFRATDRVLFLFDEVTDQVSYFFSTLCRLWLLFNSKLDFLISITGTQAKVKIRLSSSTDYIEYRQKIQTVFRYKKKVFVTHSLAFSSIKRKGKSLRNFFFYFKKKLKKVKWETPKKENVVPI